MKRLEFEYLPLDQIDISLLNVRKANLEEGMEGLKSSIKEIGIQQPVVVFQKEDRRYELIIGQRRYLACKRLGLKKIPTIITTIKNKTEATTRSFSENIHRLDLEYQDKMQAAIELIDKFGSKKEVARHLGVTPETIRNWLGYADVPETIRKMVDEGKLHPTTALRIWRKIPDEKQAVRIAQKIEEIPRTEGRGRIIDVAEENPNMSPEEIVKLVKGLKKITIHVTRKVYNALTHASKEYGSDREDIITDVLEEWLEKRGFVE